MRRTDGPSSSSIVSPVTSARALRFFADGNVSPRSHSHTVGCATLKRRASSVWVIFSSARYCLSLSTPPNIGDSYLKAIGLSYAGDCQTCGVVKTPPKRTAWDRLKEAMTEAGKGKTQQDLADLVGITQPSVAEWNRADGGPSLPTAIDLAEKLNTCVEWILTGRGPKHPGPPLDALTDQLMEVWKTLSPDQRRDLVGHLRMIRLPAAAPDTPEAEPQRARRSPGAGPSRAGT